MTQDELNKVLDAHAEWLRSGGTSGEPADLSERYLELLSFRNRPLRGITLEKAVLRGCDFMGADLSDAFMAGCNIEESCLVESTLHGVDFSDADMEDVDMTGARANSSTFAEASLDRARMRRVKMVNCDFTKASMVGAEMTDAILHYSRFNDTNLSYSSMVNVATKGACFDGANRQECQFIPINEPVEEEVLEAFIERLQQALRLLEVDEDWLQDYDRDHYIDLMEVPLHEAAMHTLDIYRSYKAENEGVKL